MTDEKEWITNNEQQAKESRQVGSQAENGGSLPAGQERSGDVINVADQQEGSMNNGECGGRLSSEEQDGNSF